MGGETRFVRATAILAGLIVAVALNGCQCSGEGSGADRAAADAAFAVAVANAPMSVVIVTIDTLRADRVGVYAPDDPYVFTPTLDALAAKGVRYTEAFTTAPLTLPAHASLFTGQTPVAHKIRDNVNYRLPADTITLATVLQRAGYATAAFVSAETVAAPLGLAQGFDVYDDERTASALPGLALSERPGRETMDRALAWLSKRIEIGRAHPMRWQPVFLWVHLFDPHFPYRPEHDLRPDTRRRPAVVSPTMPADEAAWQRAMARYDAEVTWADHQVGRLWSALETAKMADRTAIVITSDHGEALGAHGEATHGFFCYRETMRVPLIVIAPKTGEPGRAIDEPVSLIDVAPTILALLGIGIDTATSPLAAQSAGLVGILGRTERTGPPPYFESFFGTLAFGYAPIRGIVGATVPPDPRPTLWRRGETMLWSHPPEWYAASDTAQIADRWPTATSAERAMLRAHMAQALTALDDLGTTTANHQAVVPRKAARGGGVDLGVYPGVGPAITDTNTTAQSADESAVDAVYGTTYPARLFAESLDAPEFSAPSPRSQVADIQAYQRAQRLAAAEKYPLARAVLAEALQRNPHLAPAWLLVTECYRLEAEATYNALVAQHRHHSGGLSPQQRQQWRPRGESREAILQLYARAADAYREYVRIMVAADPTDTALAHDLSQMMALREFFAGRHPATERTLGTIPPRDLRPRALLALALSLHYQGGTEFARLVLDVAAPDSGTPAAELAQLFEASDPPKISADPADLNHRFGFP